MAENKHDEAVRKKELARQYAEKLGQHEKYLKATMSKAQLDFFLYRGNKVDTTIFDALQQTMRESKTVISNYISETLAWLFGKAIPKREREVLMYFADRLQEYPYSDSYARRSFRTSDRGAYASKLANMIHAYGHGNVIDAPLSDILNRNLPEDVQAYFDEYSWRGCGYTAWQVAYALDHRDSAVEEAVQRILTEENGAGTVSVELIKGVLCSQRSDFYTLVGKLLLAARLQEGLRQIICESADCGTKEAFLTILQVIADHHLIRFSSVKRAVGTWLGLLSEESRDLERVSEKSVHLIIDCIQNQAIPESYLESEDAMQIHIALWSYGFGDVVKAIAKVEEIAHHGSEHQLLVAGYFTANLDLPYVSNKIAKIVLDLHRDKEKVVAVWLPCYMPMRAHHLWQAAYENRPLKYDTWFDDKNEIDAHYRIVQSLHDNFTAKTKTYSPCVFPWYEVKISKGDFSEILCTLAALSENTDAIDEACGYISECHADRRGIYFATLLRNPKTPIQRRALLEGLSNKESVTRQNAYKRVLKLKLSRDEYQSIEDYLRFKNAEIRKYVMDILLQQNNADLQACIGRLLQDSREDVRFAGMDMLLQLQKDAGKQSVAFAFTDILHTRAGNAALSEKEKILLQALLPATTASQKVQEKPFDESDVYHPTEFDAEYTEQCLGIYTKYFPDSRLPEQVRQSKGGVSLLSKIKAVLSDNVACKSAIKAALDLLSLSKFIEEHKTVSFINHEGESVLLTNFGYSFQFRDREGKLPLRELWQTWLESNGVTNQRVLRASVLFHAYKKRTPFSENCIGEIRTLFGTGFELGRELPHGDLMDILLRHFCACIPQQEMTQLASALAIWFVRCVSDDRVLLPTKNKEHLPKCFDVAHLLGHPQLHLIYSHLSCKNDEMLPMTFPLAVAAAQRCFEAYDKIPKQETFKTQHGYHSVPKINSRVLCCPDDDYYRSNEAMVNVNAYLFAAYRGLLTKEQLLAYFFHADTLRGAVEVVSAVASAYFERGQQIAEHDSYKGMRSQRMLKEFLGKDEIDEEQDDLLLRYVADVYNTMIPVLLASELSRGDTPTTYSDAIHGISRIYGATNLAAILAALGNDTLDRSAYYGWGSADDRRGSLSYLLSVCIPDKADSADTLRTALADKQIKPKKLIEAAMFSPEWIPIIGQYLEIDAFESVCYYFIAHMNERFDDKRKAMIARYTPLSEDELNLGAFDTDWFRSAYAAIGEKEFALIYDAAKYISDGAKHSRARKYADATLGKYDIEEIEGSISDKRNKDLLMAYALIPLSDEDDLCRRYLVIQRFRKESKQFGSQRVASEGKAVEMALKNLATNAGYSDTMRLILRMETKVLDDSQELLLPQSIEDVVIKIVFDDSGKAMLQVEKDGRELKSLPARLKKHEGVLLLNQTVKTLTEQYRRTRVMLEQAMEDQTCFSYAELVALKAHPVVYPMLKNLVLRCDDHFGFLVGEGLVDAVGDLFAPTDVANVRIAHPYDLYQRGCWREYQQYLYDHKITQPYRQVFRELYVKTVDERDTYRSLRYAGHQIQPAKTVATLKSRRWVADVEAGLQKVYYKENIIAQIYALADWFSPADIESPTLEWVCFSDRKTGEELRISEIPEIIFSEVMRDVDLAVSVAHAGGVDPETSHSTVEMRAAILSFLLPMLRISNVRIDGHHAVIQGTLAEYSVHMGSGVVHQIGGAMIPVLPVHSQHRGKIFLPFIDDDPKTAEIISKILLFAEDTKIKDPMILAMICKSTPKNA